MERGDVDLAVGMLMVRAHRHRVRTIFNQHDESGTKVAVPTSVNVRSGLSDVVTRPVPTPTEAMGTGRRPQIFVE